MKRTQKNTAGSLSWGFKQQVRTSSSWSAFPKMCFSAPQAQKMLPSQRKKWGSCLRGPPRLWSLGGLSSTCMSAESQRQPVAPGRQRPSCTGQPGSDWPAAGDKTVGIPTFLPLTREHLLCTRAQIFACKESPLCIHMLGKTARPGYTRKQK